MGSSGSISTMLRFCCCRYPVLSIRDRSSDHPVLSILGFGRDQAYLCFLPVDLCILRMYLCVLRMYLCKTPH